MGFPRDKMVGSYPACVEQEIARAGEAAIGFICATWFGTGRNFPLWGNRRAMVLPVPQEGHG